jgi:hypothetical protein
MLIRRGAAANIVVGKTIDEKCSSPMYRQPVNWVADKATLPYDKNHEF